MKIRPQPFVPPQRPASPMRPVSPMRSTGAAARSGSANHGLTESGSFHLGANPSAAVANRGDRFAEMLVGEVKQVNQMQLSADNNVHALLTGGDVSEAEVLTSVQKADLAFRMLLQVRNKLMDAYREIQQIQV